MIRNLLLGIAISFTGMTVAQNITLEPAVDPVSGPVKFNRHEGLNKSLVTCSNDSVYYPLAKATAAGLYSMVGNGGGAMGEGMGQYYDAPQPITIYGFDFYGRGKNLPVLVNVRVYSASPVDSTPVTQLATATHTLPTVATPTLANLQQSVTFTSPVTVTGPYLVVIEGGTTSIDTFQLVANANGDGMGERLPVVRVLSSVWMKVADAYGTDVDLLAMPLVSYSLNSNFSMAGTLCAGSPLTFTSTSSPVLDNRFYNAAVFSGLGGYSHSWDFDDGNTDTGMVATHTYASGGNYNVALYDTLFGWTSNCMDDSMMAITVGDVPAASFTVSSDTIMAGDSLGVFNTSTSSTSCTIDFGDGSPVVNSCDTAYHTYLMANSYTVTVIATNSCGSDTSVMTVVVDQPSGINSLSGNEFRVYPNPASDQLNIDLGQIAGVSEITVITLDGREVLNMRSADRMISLSTENLEPGMYSVRVRNEKGAAVKTVSVIH